MTIIINVCWVDKMNCWYDHNAEYIKEGMFLVFLLGSIPSLIISILRYFNIEQFFTFGHSFIDEITTAFFFMYGIVAIYTICLFIFYLTELNEEHHWFELKHCETLGTTKQKGET